MARDRGRNFQPLVSESFLGSRFQVLSPRFGVVDVVPLFHVTMSTTHVTRPVRHDNGSEEFLSQPENLEYSSLWLKFVVSQHSKYSCQAVAILRERLRN